MKISCIYIIRSKVKPERFYIGSAVNFCNRKITHLRDLRLLRHPNLKLQRHFNKYGNIDLSFEILERITDLSKLIEREQFYIDLYNPFFNICKIAGNPSGIRLGARHTESAKKKMSISKKGTKHSEEHKERMRILMTGKKMPPFTEEHKLKLSIARKKRIITEETKRKISESGRALHRKVSDEVKARISAKNKLQVRTEEQRRVISKFNTGRKNGPRSEDIKLKISIGNKGKIRTEETKQKLREAKLGTKRTKESILKGLETKRINKLLKLSA